MGNKTKQNIKILDSGYVSRDDAAFPTVAQLKNGDLICAFTCKGNGPDALGGTDWARSTDKGATWVTEGSILAPGDEPITVNSLRLSLTENGTLLAYGQFSQLENKSRSFGNETSKPVLCRSLDNGHTWSEPESIPTDICHQFEISNPILPLDDSHWLAPAATLPSLERLGEKVLVFATSDGGATWPDTHTVFEDPEKKKGFFEQKLIRLDGNRLLAVAWTVTLGDYSDLENHYSVSNDNGRTWSTASSTGIMGQTMTPISLGDGRLLLLSNRRYGEQGIVMYLARFTEGKWKVEFEDMLWDAKASRHKKSELNSGIEAFDDFAFGLPSAIEIAKDTFLAVHWCKEDGIFGIRWTRLHI